MSDDLKSAAGRKLNFFQTLGAVLWSFTGLRRGADYRNEAAKRNPIYVIIAGVVMAVVFVVVLLLIVRTVVG